MGGGQKFMTVENSLSDPIGRKSTRLISAVLRRGRRHFFAPASPGGECGRWPARRKLAGGQALGATFRANSSARHGSALYPGPLLGRDWWQYRGQNSRHRISGSKMGALVFGDRVARRRNQWTENFSYFLAADITRSASGQRPRKLNRRDYCTGLLASDGRCAAVQSHSDATVFLPAIIARPLARFGQGGDLLGRQINRVAAGGLVGDDFFHNFVLVFLGCQLERDRGANRPGNFCPYLLLIVGSVRVDYFLRKCDAAVGLMSIPLPVDQIATLMVKRHIHAPRIFAMNRANAVNHHGVSYFFHNFVSVFFRSPHPAGRL